MVQIRIKKLKQDALMPKKAYEYDAAFDLHSAEEVMLCAGERRMVGTGIAIEMPQNYHAEIRPRSGLAAKHGITVLNAPGTIDSGYRGEVQVILINLGKEDFLIAKGERIAQMLFSKVDAISFEEVDELTESARGAGGFGSSGRK